MPNQVVTGALMMCTMGEAPAPLNATPTGVEAGGLPAATIMDFVPMDNIPTFGLCQSPTNPVVIAATAAKLGVFTPAPCVPSTVAPWVPGSVTTMIMDQPALTDECKCMCAWEGEISITFAGQEMVQVD